MALMPGGEFGAFGGFGDFGGFGGGFPPQITPLGGVATGGMFSSTSPASGGPPRTITGRGQLHIYDKYRAEKLTLLRTESHECSLETPAFASGACREAFKLRMPSLDPNATFVAKRYSKPKLAIEAELELDFKQAHIAADFAKQFNAYGPPKKVYYVIPHMILDLQGTRYTVEPMLQGAWQKHNNIFGWCESDRCTPAAFAHFTYVASRGEMMVLDVQGCGDHYTDPAVCTRNRRFGFTDFGEEGFHEFRKVHKCNDVCRLMQLHNTPPGTKPVPALPAPRFTPEDAFTPSPTDARGGRSRVGGASSGTSPNSSDPRRPRPYEPPRGAPGKAPSAAAGGIPGAASGGAPAKLSPVASPSPGGAPSGPSAAPPRAAASAVEGRVAASFRRDGGLVLQEVYGDVQSSSDPIAVVVPANLDLTNPFLATFDRLFGVGEALRAQNIRLGTVAVQPRRSREFFYLVAQTKRGAPIDMATLSTTVHALARMLRDRRATRLSIPESFGASLVWEDVRDLILRAFSGTPITIHCYLAPPAR